jgi:hypothetical protein
MAVVALIFGSELNSLHAVYKYRLDRVRSETHEGRLVEYRLFYYDAAFKSLDDGLDWLKKNAKTDDVVATAVPHWAYLKIGLKAVRPPLEANSEQAQALLDSVPVAYVVLDRTQEAATIAYMLALVQGNPRGWKLVYADEKGGVSVYERVRAGGGNKGKLSRQTSAAYVSKDGWKVDDSDEPDCTRGFPPEWSCTRSVSRYH